MEPVNNNNKRFLISDLCMLMEAYLQPKQVAEVYRAYLLGAEAHNGQTRKSGEAYIFHPLSVAGILANMKMDAETITAAILHDVIEDTSIDKSTLTAEFGATVALLVDGVSKLHKIHFKNKAAANAASFHKMMQAMHRDVRVIIVKLADRLHNMRTIRFMSQSSRHRISRETLEIYAPLAARLCMGNVARELESLSFKGLYPLRDKVIQHHLQQQKARYQTILLAIETDIHQQLEQKGINIQLRAFVRSNYSIYKKIKSQRYYLRDIKNIHDIFGLRVIVQSIDQCYLALGMIHNAYRPKPGTFKDYIALPHSNQYRALHTTLVASQQRPMLNIYICTQDMQDFADRGIACRGIYKIKKTQDSARAWVENLIVIQQDDEANKNIKAPADFMEQVRTNLMPDDMYVFTPQGHTVCLPQGATLIDFAYSIHTDIGHQMVSAKIDNQIVARLETPLRTGQTIQIITSVNTSPKPEWLKFTASAKARNHIRHYLKHQTRQQAIALGQRLLDKALELADYTLNQLDDEQRQHMLTTLECQNWQDLLSDIGLSKRPVHIVMYQLEKQLTAHRSQTNIEPTQQTFFIRGTEGMLIQLSSCCRPIPEDNICGYIQAGRGIIVHRDVCPAIQKTSSDSYLSLNWQTVETGRFLTDLCLETNHDRGILGKISTALAELDINISNVHSNDNNEYAQIYFCIPVQNNTHLGQLLKHLRTFQSVRRVYRVPPQITITPVLKMS